MIPISGLTENEVQTRRQQGLGNDSTNIPSRSYWDIIRTNLFTLFNNILFVLGMALIALGRYTDALTSVGLGLTNAVISTLQEMRAKRQLDQIALVNSPKVTVIREGQEKVINPEELVKGDVMHVRAGDQIVVDGVMIGEGALEMDESLLTGESHLIRKKTGDPLFSGSFCVTGQGYFEANKVGAESLANQITATARQFQTSLTPLQKNVNFVVRLVMLLVAVMSIIIMANAVLEGLPTVRLVQVAAVLSGQVPYGLFFMIVVAYSLGASTIAKKGALVQQVNAIESLSNIDILCTDKTGTLTTNRLQFNEIYPLNGLPAETIKTQLGDFSRSASTHNATSEAIMAGTLGQQRPVADEVPFASARKWSALAFSQPGRPGLYVLGAVEMLRPYLPPQEVEPTSPLIQQLQTWSNHGLRVLLFAHNKQVGRLHNPAGQPELPPLTPLALVSLSDELRPHAQETISAFQQLGIELKVISGDNPYTVAALAKQVGFPPDVKLVSGPELAEMSPAEFDQTAEEVTIFGRISPEQKEKLVDALLRQQKRVAMMGDGVNDVLSLKKASLGIAMQSGSSAARNVADMVLLNDSFAALQPAFHEGRRIMGGMANALHLFLSRVLTTTLLIMAITMVGLDFPFDPAQVALTGFTVGLPSFFLTLWARPQKLDWHPLPALARFVFPVAIVTMLFGVAVYIMDYNVVYISIPTETESYETNAMRSQWQQIIESYTGVAFGSEGYANIMATVTAQGSLSMFISWTAPFLILFLEPPHSFFLGWRKQVSPDKRPGFLALALLIWFGIIWAIPSLGYFFGILHKPKEITAMIMGTVIVWFFVMRTIWRNRFFERFLGLDDIE